MRLLEEISILLLMALTFLVMPSICAIVAKKRNRSPAGWFLLGLIGAFPLIVLLLLPPVGGAAASYRQLIKSRAVIVITSIYAFSIAGLLTFFAVELITAK
ncbi:MAG: hypothetical protein ACYC6Z_08115 [Thermoleophilia bacterium]